MLVWIAKENFSNPKLLEVQLAAYEPTKLGIKALYSILPNIKISIAKESCRDWRLKEPCKTSSHTSNQKYFASFAESFLPIACPITPPI